MFLVSGCKFNQSAGKLKGFVFVAKIVYICDKTERMDSTEKRIMKLVEAGGEGKVYFPSDFFECGTEKAVSKALQRLVQADVLMRMERGLYCFPTIDRKWGMGRLPASSDEVLAAYAQRDGFRTGPCPGEAQNALGLSEQVVMNPVYTTDGPSRKIHFYKGFRPIVLYHVPPKVFQYKSRVIMLAVIALTDIGRRDLWQFNLDGMKAVFARVPYSEVRDDLRNTPGWIRHIILDFYRENGAVS